VPEVERLDGEIIVVDNQSDDESAAIAFIRSTSSMTQASSSGRMAQSPSDDIS
jgi:hypothetical protein